MAETEDARRLIDIAQETHVEVDCKNMFERQLRLTLEEKKAASKEESSANTTDATEDDSKGYTYMLVMRLADRNLDTTLRHDGIAGRDFFLIRKIAADLGKALNRLHTAQPPRIHADLKPLNAVRIGSVWLLIDLDVSCIIGERFSTKVPSSAFCPPEMGRVLQAATDIETGMVDTTKLREYIADVAYDLWSFGVVLYHLVFGRALWNNDVNDNVTPQDLKKICSLTANQVKWEFLIVRPKDSDDLKTAADLLGKLLEPDPKMRLSHWPVRPGEGAMEVVLAHPFFHGQTLDAQTLKEMNEKLDRQNEKLDRIEQNTRMLIDLNREHKNELRRTSEVLMKAIFEATEVMMPTTFIVLHNKLPVPSAEEKQKFLTLQAAEDGSGVSVAYRDLNVKITDEGVDVDWALADKYKEQYEEGMKWIDRVKRVGGAILNMDGSAVFKTVEDSLPDLVKADTMYLYLIDELTGKPVEGEGYPIGIKKPAAVVAKLLPVMQVGLRAMSIYNGAAGIVRMCGFPIPKIPKDWRDSAQSSVELLKQESSVAEFGVVQAEVDKDSGKASESVRGASLRELQDFLGKNDPGLKKGGQGSFAGLQRVADTENGIAIWTCLSDPKAIKQAVEARSKERREEQRRSEELIRSNLSQAARESQKASPRKLKAELQMPQHASKTSRICSMM